MSTAQRAGVERGLLRIWQQRGGWAVALWPLSLPYGALVRLRRWCFECGWRRSTRLAVPVIVVGNLIVGGAGKTPVVLALLDLLAQLGWRVGVISRGYGRVHDEITEVTPRSTAQEVGDEPLLLARRGQVPVVVGRDRVRAAQRLLEQHPEVQVIVSDDGLQHLALQRDVQIIVFDERGVGNGYLLPAGPLREPLPRQCPARSLVLYNAQHASTPWPGHFGQRRLTGLVSWAAWYQGQAADLNALRQLAQRSQHAPVLAAAGIAQPERFFTLLRQSGLQINPLPLPDHHDFAGPMPWPQDTPCVIVTEKDAVKLSASSVGSTEIWVAPLDFRLEPSFTDALAHLMPTSHFRSHHGHPTA